MCLRFAVLPSFPGWFRWCGKIQPVAQFMKSHKFYFYPATHPHTNTHIHRAMERLDSVTRQNRTLETRKFCRPYIRAHAASDLSSELARNSSIAPCSTCVFFRAFFTFPTRQSYALYQLQRGDGEASLHILLPMGPRVLVSCPCSLPAGAVRLAYWER